MTVYIKPEDRQKVSDLLKQMEKNPVHVPWYKFFFSKPTPRTYAGRQLINLLVPEANLTENSSPRDFAGPVGKILGRKIYTGETPNDGKGELVELVKHELISVVRAQLRKDV